MTKLLFVFFPKCYAENGNFINNKKRYKLVGKEICIIILLVSSNKDIASQNITEQVLRYYPFQKNTKIFQNNPIYHAFFENHEFNVAFLDDESIYAQYLNDFYPCPELIVFLSRHSSLSGKPTLSVHVSGNFDEAEYGGIKQKLSVAPASAMRDALKSMAALKEENDLQYEVSYECTHHGPSLDIPSMFVELGSSIDEWQDLQAAEIVAHAAMKAALSFPKSQAKSVIGIGGPHYSEKFTRLALESQIAFSHIIPKHAIQKIDSTTILQCIHKTLEHVECAFLDWKGIRGEHKIPLLDKLEEIGLPYEKV